MEDIGDRVTRIQTLTLGLFSNNPRPTPCTRSRSKKRPRSPEETSPFECLSEEILFLILDRLDESPLDRKAFSLVARSFHAAESRHRRVLRPRRSYLLPAALSRYPSVSHLDLSLCPRVGAAARAAVAGALRSSLQSIDLSRSRMFCEIGLESLAVTCAGLVEIDLSNGTDLSDAAAAAIAKARNLEKLWLARCKTMTDMGLACIAVGCPKLRLLCLRWCLGVTDLGVGLVAAKCKKLRSLDLSYTMITKKCLPAVMQLPCLEDLALVGCLGIDDQALLSLKQRCKSLGVLDVSNCQHVTHLGLSSILSRAPGLCQLNLAYSSPFTQSLASSLQKLSKLVSITLDGCPVTLAGLKAIANSCTSLKELSLSKCSGVTDEGLSSVVVKHKALMKLDLACCRSITDVSVANICHVRTHICQARMRPQRTWVRL